MAKQQYETMFIVSPLEKEKEVKKVADRYSKLLKNEGAKLVNQEEWGLQQFAYPIQKYNSGYYFLFEYNGESETPKTLETEFNRDHRVIRYMTVKLDKYGIKHNDRRREKGFALSKVRQKQKKQKENA